MDRKQDASKDLLNEVTILIENNKILELRELLEEYHIIDIFEIMENLEENEKIKLFEGEETEKFLSEMNLELLGELPMTREIIEITHNGVSEVSDELDVVLNDIVSKINNKISK